jgi:CheY-like chemotaxis protein
MNGLTGPILLVEDDPGDIAFIRRAYGKTGASTPLVVTEDGDSAVDYLGGSGAYADRAAHPFPCLMLLDLKLPRRSGLEVLEWLRGQAVIRRLPVVILTSSRENRDIDRAYELGVNSYLLKPVRTADLADTIKRVTDYWLLGNQGPNLPGR